MKKLTSQDIPEQKDNTGCLFAFQTAHLRLSTSSQVQLFKCHFSNLKRSVVLKRVAGQRISTVEKQSAILQGFTEILGRTILRVAKYSFDDPEFLLTNNNNTLYSHDFHRVL